MVAPFLCIGVILVVFQEKGNDLLAIALNIRVSTPLNLVFGIWDFDIDLRVSLFLGLVVTNVDTLLAFGAYWD